MHDQQMEQFRTKINTPHDFTATTTSSTTITKSIPGTGIFSSCPRGSKWQTNSKSVNLHLEKIYSQLCNDQSPYQRLIQRDLTRTFPGIDMFKQENGPGQMAVYRILVAYSLYDTQVGYCQGLAFLVGPLLMNIPEPQAFCVFVRMMEVYGMRSMYTLKMEGLQLHLYQFSCLLKVYLPNLAEHFDQHSVHPAMYASQWFLTVFAYVFPMELVTKIYDMLFVEGALETMMRVAIALLKKSEHIILLENEFEDLLDCVATRKLCTPYGNDWSDVINDAMALSNEITQQKLDQLAIRYQQVDQQEKHQTEQAINNNRLGKFWRRRKSSKKMKNSSCYNSTTDGDDSLYTSELKKTNNDATDLNSPTNEANNIHIPSSKTGSIDTTMAQDIPNQQLLDALDQLQKKHNQALDKLLETKMDKMDVENERDALKMTIMELERERRHYQQSSPNMEHSAYDATINNVLDDSYQQCLSPYDGKTLMNYGKYPSQINSCSNSSDMTAISGHRKSLSLSSTASTLINFTPDTITGMASPPPSINKIHSVEDASLHSSSSSSSFLSWSRPYDIQQLQQYPRMNHFRTCSNESDTGTNDGSIIDTLTSSTDKWDALRTELVRAKVAHFESQQHCELLEQDILDYQSRLDTMNEGQMALMDKLVKITSELDDVLQDKKRYDEKWFDLVQENSRLTVQLEQQQQYHKQAPASLSSRYLKAKIYHLETSLAATKVQLENLESSSDLQHPTNPPTLSIQERSTITTCRQNQVIRNIKRVQLDDDDESTHDPLLEARTVGNGRIGRSVTLYGRMWHAISPRAQTIGSS